MVIWALKVMYQIKEYTLEIFSDVSNVATLISWWKIEHDYYVSRYLPFSISLGCLRAHTHTQPSKQIGQSAAYAPPSIFVFCSLFQFKYYV